MLDFSAPVRNVAGVDLAAAADSPLAFFVLPGAARAAVVDGVPGVALLRFLDEGEITGGHLDLTLEAGVPAERLAAARAVLEEELGETVELRPITPTRVEAELLFLGRVEDEDGGLSGLVKRGFGRAAGRFDNPYRARFALDLEPEGVSLFESALRSGVAPVGVNYRFSVEGLWPAMQATAQVNWGRVYDHFSMHQRRGAVLLVDDIQRLSEELIDEQVVRIHAVQGLTDSESPLGDPAPVLAWIQREMVERICEEIHAPSREPVKVSLGGLGEVLGAGSAYAVRKSVQIERLAMDVDFQRRVVQRRTLTTQGHLADFLGDVDADSIIADADREHPFFKRFELDVEANEPFDVLDLEEVVLQVRYGTSESTLELPDGGPAHFEAWADASDTGTWSLQPRVRFRDGSDVGPEDAVILDPITGSGRKLTVDLRQALGLRRIRLGPPADSRVLVTRAKVAHERGGVELSEREVLIQPGEAEVSVWLRDYRAGDRVAVTPSYLVAGPRMIEGATIDAETEVLRLPNPFPGSMTVTLISDSDWSDLEHVVVALRKEEGGPVGTFTFDGPSVTKPVALDMPDPDDRSYGYRATRTWSSGVVEEDDWVTTDSSVLLVGKVAANRMVVDVTPLGVEPPQAGIRVVEVQLTYLDVENRLREQHAAVIEALADTSRWEFEIVDPNRREYEYRIIKHFLNGERVEGPRTRSSERILPIPILPS